MTKIKSTIFNFSPKLIIFCLALFNYVYIYSKIPQTQTGGAISFYTPDWYETSNFIVVPLLLLAAFLLLISRKWIYLIAIALSGIFVIEGFIQCFRVNLIDVWKFVQKNEPDIFLQWEMQFFLAIIIFSAATLYLRLKILNKSIR